MIFSSNTLHVVSPRLPIPKLLINNEWRNSVSGKTFDAICPADESVLATVQEADKEDVGECCPCIYMCVCVCVI